METATGAPEVPTGRDLLNALHGSEICLPRSAAIAHSASLRPATAASENAGEKLRKVGRDLTWTPGLQDNNERHLRAIRRLGKQITCQMAKYSRCANWAGKGAKHCWLGHFTVPALSV